MVDNLRVYRMAVEYQMNPERARKLLEMAGKQPEIVRLIRKYNMLKEGGAVGQENPGGLHRCL